MRRIKKIVKRMDEKFFNKILYRTLVKIGFVKIGVNDSLEKNGNQFDDFFFDSEIKEKLEYVDPKEILTSSRLDVVVRYLLFKNLKYNNLSKEIESLYSRTILVRTGGVEPKEYYSPNEKVGIKKHIEAASILLKEIEMNGFKQEFYIPIAKDYGLYNGAHRLAAAIALDQNVWLKYEGNNGVKDLNFQWFLENGFSVEDQIRILRGFAEIHNNCGIFVLYGPCQDEWNYIQRQVEKKVNIVGYVDLDFSRNYIAFENLIHDIYMDYNSESVIERKIELLKFSNLCLRVILISDELDTSKNFYGDLSSLKSNIRNLLNSTYPSDAFITLHGSDNKKEFVHMKNVLLSVNNIRCLKMRTSISRRETFIGWIEKFKSYCSQHGIDVNDTCIIGSSPLEVMGIRNSTDIDIVISAELRNTFGNGIVHLTNDLDVATRNYVKNESTGEVYVFDEQLIYDDNYHFIFNGCKFANIELIYKRKHSSVREKDKKDVRLMDLFFDCSRYFDDKRLLQEQIQKELKRRNK